MTRSVLLHEAGYRTPYRGACISPFCVAGVALPLVIPDIEPVSFQAGDTVQWTKTLHALSPADGYGLTYSIRGPSVLDDTKVVVTPQSSNFSVLIAAADTASLQPGTYQWCAYATVGTGPTAQRYEDSAGVLVVRPNLQTVTTPLISWAAAMLNAVETVLSGRIPADVTSYGINGRSLAREPLQHLLTLRDRLRLEVRRERNPRSAGPSRAVRFGRTW